VSIGRNSIPLGTLVLDTGGVLEYVEGARSARTLCRNTHIAGYPVILPTAVYAQVERGGQHHSFVRQRLNDLLNICEVAPLMLGIARQAGWLLGDSGTTDVVDAVVVVEALNRGDTMILISDIGDIQHLLSFGPNRTRRNVRVLRP
jgi:hypothetical protein